MSINSWHYSCCLGKEFRYSVSEKMMKPTIKLKVNFFYLILLSLTFVSGSVYCEDFAVASDSLGIQKKASHWVIAHEVDPGETVYALSQRYGVAIEQIIKFNPGIENGLQAGHILYIPFSSGPYFMHKVRKGETLYSISKIYNISVDELKTWNAFRVNEIHTGQELKIVENRAVIFPEQSRYWIYHHTVPGENLYSIAKKYQVTVADLKKWNALVGDEIVVGQQIKLPGGSYNEVEQTLPDTTLYPVSNGNEIHADEGRIAKIRASDITGYPVMDFSMREERGLAALIEGTGNSNKFLALHRTAPPGTILIVRNELNNQVVFVRVIGKLPDTGTNNKVIVKISEPAWININAVNRKLRVKVSYLGQD